MEDVNRTVAACGLYCGSCGKFRQGKCPGCRYNEQASWCKIRACCIEHGYATCAECTFSTVADCKKFNFFVARLVSYFTRNDRQASIHRIQAVGREVYASEMKRNGRLAIRRR